MIYNILIWLHRGMFALILVVAFLMGALNAGKADMLMQMQAKHYLSLSLAQLTEVPLL